MQPHPASNAQISSILPIRINLLLLGSHERVGSAALRRGRCPPPVTGAHCPGIGNHYRFAKLPEWREVMKYVNGFLCVVLALFTIVQYNDPDALLWILILPTVWASGPDLPRTVQARSRTTSFF